MRDLQIADRIYDPWADTEDEIIDILTREVSMSRLVKSTLRPVCLQTGAIGDRSPCESTLVSPKQMVARLRPMKTNPRYKCFVLEAADMIDGATVIESLESVTYHCIFFERKRYLQVNGLHLLAYTTEDLTLARI